MKKYFTYIITNRSKTLYTGCTNNIQRRIREHKSGKIGFTSKYRIDKLVYVEEFNSPRDAIVREKQIKGWLRKKKTSLIESINPDWTDLSDYYA